jgi:predicted CoA-binding protein
VVGLSPDPSRDSYRVADYLRREAYDIVPINPLVSEVFGIQSYPDLLSAPRPIEVVDIFRRVEFISDIVDQAIRTAAKAVWMQQGLIEQTSAERARQAGLLVVMNRCILVEHKRHFGRH